MFIEFDSEMRWRGLLGINGARSAAPRVREQRRPFGSTSSWRTGCSQLSTWCRLTPPAQSFVGMGQNFGQIELRPLPSDTRGMK